MAKFLDGVGLSRVWTRMKSYIANTNYTKAEVDAILATIPSRMRYRGNCLYDAVTNTPGEFESIDAIQAAVSNGDFSNIFIGDYILVQITTVYTANETVKLLVADIDYYLNRGGLEITKVTNHHLILVPENCFTATAIMNSSDSTAGGYYASMMNVSNLSIYATVLSTVLNSHLLTIPFKFSTYINTSAQNDTGGQLPGVASTDGITITNISLMTEAQVFGMRLFSNVWDLGYVTQQLALFALRPNLVPCGLGYSPTQQEAWWLSGVASSYAFCLVDADGYPFYYREMTYGSQSLGVRPLVVFG